MALQISRLLHAGYLFQSESASIAFDPIFETPFSRNCYAYPAVEFNYESIRHLKLDAVFISHYHDDHCSLESLQYLNKNTPIYLYCVFSELHDWLHDLGFQNTYSLELNTSVKIGDFEVIPRRALDADVDCLFHVKHQGLNVLNVVDSWIDDLTLTRLKETSWDLIMWPFQTMREIEVLSPARYKASLRKLPEEWLLQIKSLNPKVLIPSSCQFIHESWSWYRHAYFPISYKLFIQQVLDVAPRIQILKLSPSHSLLLTPQSCSAGPPLNWIKLVEDENVDYEYRADLAIPNTQQIAQFMEALTQEQSDLVSKFCNKDLLEKYSKLPHSHESYFYKERLWRLSLFDDKGVSQVFHYQIQSNEIKIFKGHIDKSQLAWITEIPIARLYGALENGESLSSLYIRINDCFFNSNIENELTQTDLLEDPLLRCLYEGQFGTYQRAQLKRLKSIKSSSVKVL